MSYQNQLLLYRITALVTAYSTIIWVLGLLLFLWGRVIAWGIFTRAGEPGWKSLIPLYSEWIIVRNILGRGIGSYILFIVMLVLVGILPLWFMDIQYHLAKKFDKGTGFALGAAFLWPIFGGILAFENNSDNASTTSAIIPSQDYASSTTPTISQNPTIPSVSSVPPVSNQSQNPGVPHYPQGSAQQ